MERSLLERVGTLVRDVEGLRRLVDHDGRVVSGSYSFHERLTVAWSVGDAVRPQAR